FPRAQPASRRSMSHRSPLAPFASFAPGSSVTHDRQRSPARTRPSRPAPPLHLPEGHLRRQEVPNACACSGEELNPCLCCVELDWFNQSGYKMFIKTIQSRAKREILHVLFPSVRAEILRCLFFDPCRELYVRELARTTNLALRTVQQELAGLS